MTEKSGDIFFMNGTEESVLIALIVAAVVCTAAAIALSVVVAVMLKKRRAAPKRELIEISVDASAAKRKFIAGEEFQCEGLRIAAKYTPEPKEEVLTAYKVITQEELAQSEKRGEANGCYVVKPALSGPGDETVTVKYMGKTASYTVSVSEAAGGPQTPPEQTEQE